MSRLATEKVQHVSRRRSQKKLGVPAGQPKFLGAAAAAFFSARHGASQLNATTRCHYITYSFNRGCPTQPYKIN